MQQNYLMEEVLQGKRILDDVMNKKVPHLSRLNLFPFSFSFLRQLDKEALNQYLEQLQNMWEAYLRTKGTIQQPLFLQHLDFLQQIQIWYIKNNVLSNNAVHTRLRTVPRPQTTKREEPLSTFSAKEHISDDEEDDDEESDDVDDEDDVRFEKGKRRASTDDMRSEKSRDKEHERDKGRERRREREWREKEDRERREVEKEKKKKSGDSDWREDWELSSKRRKGSKKHRRREKDSEGKKHRKRRYDEREEKKKEKRKREKTRKRKKGKGDNESSEEEERSYKRRRSVDSDEKLTSEEEEEEEEEDDEEDDAELDESAGFSIYSHKGSKKRNREKGEANEEDILGNIVATDTPSTEPNTTRKSWDDTQSEKSSTPLRRPLPTIPLSTFTSNVIQGNASAVPITPRGFSEFQNSANLLNLQVPSSSAPAQGPAQAASPTPANAVNPSVPYHDSQSTQSDAQPAQVSLSYRDASQILLNPRQPSYKVPAGQGNGGKNQMGYFGNEQVEIAGLFHVGQQYDNQETSEPQGTQYPDHFTNLHPDHYSLRAQTSPAQAQEQSQLSNQEGLKMDATSNPDQEGVKDVNMAQSGELAQDGTQSQNKMSDQITNEEKGQAQQLQQMYNQRLLAQQRSHYDAHFAQDPAHQMRQYPTQQYPPAKQHAYASPPRAPAQIEQVTPTGPANTTAGVSAKSEKRLSRYRSSPSKALLERMEAALASRMHVLRRFPISPDMELSRKYTILGTTGSVYTISISNLPSCNCPDSAKGHHCCHILFVLLKILKVSQHEAVLYQRALLNAELREIYKEAPPNPSATITRPPYGVAPVQAQIAGDCPVCCEPFLSTFDNEPVVWCKGGCGSNVHKSCFEIYATHTQQPHFPDKAFCPVCETEWISDGKIMKKIPEKEVKPKRGKKEKSKSSQLS